MKYAERSREELLKLSDELTSKHRELCGRGLKFDISRGKPSRAQLDLSSPMLNVISSNGQCFDEGTDVRNYGVLLGIPSCRKLFADILEIPYENVIAGGNSSLAMMYDTLMRLWVFGAPDGEKPWSLEKKVKWLCPVPGYDRHFAICEQFGIEMINIPLTDEGPYMDAVFAHISDPAVKGIWCVPKYSNPTGTVYSDKCVKALASMKTAAKDFRIFWDNAYAVHHLTDERPRVLNILEECEKAGIPNRPFIFASTSKITYAGGGVAALACSKENVDWVKKLMSVQTIGPDKINQLRHVRFFTDITTVEEHMKKHAEILKPKFDAVCGSLEKELGGLGIASWTEPKGGYFISFDSLPGCAKQICRLCADAGLILTPAGATYPYGKDPKDSNIRIAPSLPPLSELETAMEVFCVSVKLASVLKLLS